MKSLKENKIWFLIDHPCDYKRIGYEWTFRKKLRLDGSIKKLNLRKDLLILVCQKLEGVDFFYFYSRVSKVTSIRVLIVLTCIFNSKIHWMDVKITFLNDNLEDEYINQHEGFVELRKGK